MNLVEFFQSPDVSLPLVREQGDLRAFLRDRFEVFFGLVRGLEGAGSGLAKQQASTAQALSEAIIEAMDRYYDGRTLESFRILYDALGRSSSSLHALGGNLDPSYEPMSKLYRMRSCSMAHIGRRGIFHLPFQLRHKVQTQRYSIPGHPCLYLGGSTWICWEELGRPGFGALQVSRFEITRPVRILDLGYRPRFMTILAHSFSHRKKGYQEKRNLALAHIACWPLIAACSVKVLEPEGAFIPEYVIPQMTLQWLRETGEFEGVRYFSVNLPPGGELPDHSVTQIANFAFPAQTNQERGYCSQLRDLFQFTDPVPWELVIQANLDQVIPPGVSAPFAAIPSAQYGRTGFFRVEAQLGALEAQSLTEE